MSLGVVIKGPEGLVMAAESRLTLTFAPPGAPPIHASFDNATKVFGFSRPNSAVGVVTYGLGGIGLRSAYSFVPEFEEKLSGDRLPIGDFARQLSDFYKQRWAETMPEGFIGPGITLVVAGFNEKEPYGRVYVSEIPNAADPTEQHSGPGEFGITWGGQREVVDRLLQGYDERVLAVVQQALSLASADVVKLKDALRPLSLELPLQAMPLQDCVDLAILFLKTTVEAQRLTVGIRGCGGPVDVATITREGGLAFVQRKQVHGEAATIQGLGGGPQ